MSDNILLNPSPLVRYLGKPAAEFTRADIVRYCVENEIKCINFHYCGWDGRLKTLNFVIGSVAHLESILSAGERVDGSSLFPFVQAGKSDLYVVPRYRTAFLNPFAAVPTVDLLCAFFDREGNPFESSPQHILHKAHDAFQAVTGLHMEAMGELEYYVVGQAGTAFTTADQRGYHESEPFCKFADFRTEAMRLIAQCGGQVKYGHSEVGNFTRDGLLYEQNEIEFIPTDIEDAADQLVVAKWVLRRLAHQQNVELTFAPKITVGKAGSGMHIHCRFTRDGQSAMVQGGELTAECRRAIAGFMEAGTSLPAFGNPHPLSFMRLVPHQEAPTSLCWSFSNRSALVRVPLGWIGTGDMAAKANPTETPSDCDFSSKQTFEWRASDGFADTYLLLAALCCAARKGFEMPDALDVAERTYVGLGVNIHDTANSALCNALEQLPACCVEAADELEKDRDIYTARGVFSDALVDWQIHALRAFDDAHLRESLDNDSLMQLVRDNINNG